MHFYFYCNFGKNRVGPPEKQKINRISIVYNAYSLETGGIVAGDFVVILGDVNTEAFDTVAALVYEVNCGGVADTRFDFMVAFDGSVEDENEVTVLDNNPVVLVDRNASEQII